MKKWLLAAGFILGIAMPSQASEKIAIVNMSTLFEQLAQKTGVSIMLQNEFKDRADELKSMEVDLQSKIQRLHQYDGSIMRENDRKKLEKDLILQRKTFSRKIHTFEQDRQRRSIEERSKLITRIRSAVKSIALDQHIDFVLDASVVTFNSGDVKDITDDVLKQVNK